MGILQNFESFSFSSLLSSFTFSSLSLGLFVSLAPLNQTILLAFSYSKVGVERFETSKFTELDRYAMEKMKSVFFKGACFGCFVGLLK